VNKAERTERNIRVVLMRMREVPTGEVAEAFGITDRQVRRIMAEWRESPLRRDTEGAIEAVENALKMTQDDMEALGITSAQAPPEARVAIQGARIEQLNRNFSVLGTPVSPSKGSTRTGSKTSILCLMRTRPSGRPLTSTG
jgi:hypothetical protein